MAAILLVFLSFDIR